MFTGADQIQVIRVDDTTYNSSQAVRRLQDNLRALNVQLSQIDLSCTRSGPHDLHTTGGGCFDTTGGFFADNLGIYKFFWCVGLLYSNHDT
jgi:hypothetical protein